ncbi:ABC transporter substrate-binding protein [Bradyrhizobium sp. WSM3983]|uniref:ABC transporter substrate-binding protein n=1 Tax=Bradyrhizobium sp. WSM3983 TaxID=1038867 RepID=UPI0004169FBA|nr:ABC transporter substrate-binding protein [Bradyrhizobium sp. WSM3983]
MPKHFVKLLAAAALAIGFSHHAQAADQVKVKLAEVVRSQLYVPMYAAISKGFAAEQGLDVELVTANGGDRAGALVLSGQADFALAGPEVPIYIFNGESPDKPLIFSALTATDGFFLVSRAKFDKFDWSMLNGKKIIGFRPGSTPGLYLEYVLKHHAVDAPTVAGVITNIAIPARDGAWLSGTGDFGIFMEPNLSRLEKAGQAYVVTSIGKEVGRADYTVFFAKRSWLERNGSTAQKWANAIARAQAWVADASPREIAEVIAPYFPGLSLDDNIAVVSRYRDAGVPIWASSTVVDKGGLARAQEIMVEGGTLPADKKVAYDQIVTTAYAEKAQQEFARK